MRTLIKELKAEATEQRAFKYRLDDHMKGMEAGTTLSVLEDVRARAHENDTALCHEADSLDRWAGVE